MFIISHRLDCVLKSFLTLYFYGNNRIQLVFLSIVIFYALLVIIKVIKMNKKSKFQVFAFLYRIFPGVFTNHKE